MSTLDQIQTVSVYDALLPDAARRYLAHTSDGRGIREIAREAGCHASTVLRQVRKTEAMRDDPLVDKALALADAGAEAKTAACADTVLDAAVTALKRLCQPGAMLLYSVDLPQPAVVSSTAKGETQVLGPLNMEIAAAMVMRGWVAENGGAAVKRYSITSDGRAALPHLVAARDRRANREMDQPLDAFGDPRTDRRSRDRSVSNGPGSENPLIALARRRGVDGQPFLTADLLSAGDRLHEDFQIAGIEQSKLLGWTCPDALEPLYERAQALTDARRADTMTRLLDTLRDLGPGLSDVALRCCCLREGLEITEKRMGWSARSGKIVLRIALQRLNLFYTKNSANAHVLIG